jgi:hypothetical protein
MPLLHVLLAGLAALASLTTGEAAMLTVPGPACRAAAASRVPTLAASARPAVLRRLRGGADDEDEDELDDDAELDAELEGGVDEDGEDAEADSGLDNPFLAGAGGMPGGASGLGMAEMRKSLQDPAALQKALKQLQDPATQERFRQMMEDPAFLESMKAYAEQLAKDPMFNELKEQAEKMM